MISLNFTRLFVHTLFYNDRNKQKLNFNITTVEIYSDIDQNDSDIIVILDESHDIQERGND